MIDFVWRARRDSNLRPSESKSDQVLSKFNAHSELSRSVRPLKALGNFAGSEYGSRRSGESNQREADQRAIARLGAGRVKSSYHSAIRYACRLTAAPTATSFAPGDGQQPREVLPIKAKMKKAGPSTKWPALQKEDAVCRRRRVSVCATILIASRFRRKG